LTQNPFPRKVHCEQIYMLCSCCTWSLECKYVQSESSEVWIELHW